MVVSTANIVNLSIASKFPADYLTIVLVENRFRGILRTHPSDARPGRWAEPLSHRQLQAWWQQACGGGRFALPNGLYCSVKQPVLHGRLARLGFGVAQSGLHGCWSPRPCRRFAARQSPRQVMSLRGVGRDGSHNPLGGLR